MQRDTNMYISHKISQGDRICKDNHTDETERNVITRRDEQKYLTHDLDPA